MKDLVKYSRYLRSITERSARTTDVFVQSIDYLESKANECHTQIAELFAFIELKEKRIKNMHCTMDALDVFSHLLDVVDQDRLNIMQGPRGLMEEYIEKLEQIDKIIQKVHHYLK